MRNRKSILATRFVCLMAILIAPAWPTVTGASRPIQSGQVPVRIVTASGSVFVAEIADFNFQFLTVGQSGEGQQRDFRLSEVASLHVVVQPEADSISGINELINGLANPDYRIRESSEEKLAGEVGRPEARTLLEKATNHELLEVRFRAERLLSAAGASIRPEPERWEYDRVRMPDGTEYRGDAGKFSVKFNNRNDTVTLSRGSLLAILVGAEPATPGAVPAQAELPRLNHVFQGQPFPVSLDFETGIGQRKLLRTANVGNEFADQGLLLRGQVSETEKSGAVLVSPYAFNFENRPTGGNSICVSRDPESLRSPHKGITQLRFCLPSRTGVPAGVHHLGIFGARIDYPFSFVLQCLNQDGQLIGEVASSDESCSWFEIEAAELVVAARFLANPLGLRMELPIDEDYALDNLGMSNPVPAMPLESVEGIISLRNGETIHANAITVGDQGIAARESSSGRMMRLDSKEIAWWIFPGSEMLTPKRGEVRWFAILDDRSILEVKWSSGDLVPVRWKGVTIDRMALVCLWSGQDWCRFPQGTDFGFGKSVLVFPGCRLAVPDVSMDQAGIAWGGAVPVALFQPLKVTTREAAGEDPTGEKLAANPDLAPKFAKLAWDNVDEWNLPTVWFSRPPVPDNSQGAISLKTGEKFVFGPKSGYRLASTTAQGATLVDAAGTTVLLEWKDVWRVKMPDTITE